MNIKEDYCIFVKYEYSIKNKNNRVRSKGRGTIIIKNDKSNIIINSKETEFKNNIINVIIKKYIKNKIKFICDDDDIIIYNKNITIKEMFKIKKTYFSIFKNYILSGFIVGLLIGGSILFAKISLHK